MNKLKQLEAKKLLKELEFIESDYDYKNELISEADNEFLNNVNRFLDSQPKLKEIFDKSINNKIDEMIKQKENEINEIKEVENKQDESDDEDKEKFENIDSIKDSEVENSEDIKSPKLKKLYREIAKVTHPDKVKDKKLNEYYLKATSMYDKSDLAGIYSICDELRIDYDIEEDDYGLIFSKIKQLKDRIGFIESTFAWKWFYADEREKELIVVTYIKMRLMN